MSAESRESLLQRNRELRERLEEAEEVLRALKSGEVDAVGASGPDGDRADSLKGADENYRVIVEGMAEGAVTLTPDGLVLFANQQFAAIVRSPLERVIGSRIWDFVADDDGDVLSALLRGSRGRKAELRLQSSGGSLVPVYVSVANLILDGAERLCIIVTDLTEQKRNEAIVDAEKLALSILEQAAEAMLVVDPEGAITRASRAAELLAGESVALRKFDDVFRISLGNGDAYPFQKLLSAAIRSHAIKGLEATARMPDGRKIDLRLSAATLSGADSEVSGCVVTLIDITDSKRRERQLKFQADILETTAEAVIAIDPHRRVIFWNAGAERIYGVGRADALGKPLAELYRWSWLNPADEQLADAALQGKGMWTGESIHVRTDGTQVAVSSTVNVIGEEHGGGMFAVVRDITKRKNAEAAARENDLQFRILADSIPQLAWMADEKGWIFWYNRRWYEYTGTTPEEMEGWGWRKVHHPDHLESVVERWKKHLDIGEEWEDTFPLLGNDGQFRWFLSRAQPIRNSHGEVVRWFGTNTDITERRAAEEALRESEARFRRLYEADVVGMVCCDVEKVFEGNDLFLEMVGYSRQDLEAGKILWRQMTPDEYLHLDERAMEELAATGSCKPFEKEYFRKDGSRVPILIAATLLQTSPLRWLCVILDLTERKTLEKKLFEKQKLESIGLLAGGIAHDFNNLLVGILGNASMAQELLPSGNPAAEAVEGIVQASERAAHLTRQMLAYSGKGQLVIEPVDLSNLARAVTKLVQSSIPNQIAVHLELAPDLPPVEADEGQMQQVIMNLVINAAEAIGKDAGLISVRTSVQAVDAHFIREQLDGPEFEPGTYVRLEVSDTGSGMDEETKTRIFDPFFTTKFTGRGLGLAAVAGIVRGHKGAIQVRSVPGKGSTFFVLFPAARLAAVKPEPPPRPADTEVEGADTVLIVDDEQVVLRTAKRALERRGYTVLQAESGPDAIEMLKDGKERISVVVLDLSMPGMSGQEALLELRRIKPEIEVIVSSGYNESEALRIFSGQKISGFLQKPYTSARMAEKIKDALARR